MVHYVKTIDELVELIDKEFSNKNAICPICKNKIGTVNLPNIELGLDGLHFMQFKYPGVYCTEGHCIISVEEDVKIGKEQHSESGSYRLYIQDIGIKVYEVMKLIKPDLEIDASIPNAQLYWILMKKEKPVFTKPMSYEKVYDLLEKLQRLGSRAEVIKFDSSYSI